MRKVIVISSIVLVIVAAGIFYKDTSEQQKLPRATINHHAFNLEIAIDPQDRHKGLSSRDSLPADHGMLFIFGKPSDVAFWMKDMRFPIDIIFIHGDTITSIAENVPPPTSRDQESLPVYKPETASDKVLEINAGLSQKYNIKKGDRVQIRL